MINSVLTELIGFFRNSKSGRSPKINCDGQLGLHFTYFCMITYLSELFLHKLVNCIDLNKYQYRNKSILIYFPSQLIWQICQILNFEKPECRSCKRGNHLNLWIPPWDSSALSAQPKTFSCPFLHTVRPFALL